jgi:hypothetical protein
LGIRDCAFLRSILFDISLKHNSNGSFYSTGPRQYGEKRAYYEFVYRK